jgi:predicted aspartyl protease
MGRIYSRIKIDNVVDPLKSIRCEALVDTGASMVVLPTAWRDQLGALETIRRVELETATQEIVAADVCGPVKIQLEGFDPIYSEVLFLEMHPHDGTYEPLIGYIILEQSQAAVDLVGHRLVRVKYLDLK